MLLLIVAAFLSSAAAANDGDAQDKQKQLEQLRGRIDSLQTDLDAAQKKRQTLQHGLQSVEQDIGKHSRQLRQTEDNLKHQRSKIEQLEQAQQAQRQALEQHRSALVGQLRTAYAMGRQDKLKIILNQEDPASLSRVMVYHGYFTRARSERLAAIEVIMAAQRETAAQLVQEQDRMLELQARENLKMKQLEASRTLREDLVKNLTTRIRTTGQALDELKQDELRLRNLLSKLEQTALSASLENQARASFVNRKGKMSWPSKGQLSVAFGQEKGGGMRWDGVVISASEGGDVQAIHGGRVVFADWLRGFGLLLIIDHGDGYMSLYGHNQSLLKEAGEWVAPGDVVGLVGNSGGQPRSGVYFAIRHKGRPVNPTAWCIPWKGTQVGAWRPAEISRMRSQG